MTESLWINGPVRSGKTTRLIQRFCQWLATDRHSVTLLPGQSVLVFADNADNRIALSERLVRATQGQQSLHLTTPLGFFQDEVVLFWSLLVRQFNLPGYFPLRLRSENEQELARQLWETELHSVLRQEGVTTDQFVRRLLDVLQLAAFRGVPLETVPEYLAAGFADQEMDPSLWPQIGTTLCRWRDWCLQRGLITYGILTELYWRHLLPQPEYQHHLQRRFGVLLADDVDNYPAIARDLFEQLFNQGTPAVLTYNPQGAIRLGLGADPQYMAGLQQYCQIEHQDQPVAPCLAQEVGDRVIEILTNPSFGLPDSLQTVQEVARSQLLRRTGNIIVEAVRSGAVAPQEIAIIGPGLDAIARYSLIEILTRQGIAVESLNDQRPLNSSPLIRAVLTALTLIYPGLGRLIDRDQVAEMLVMLTLTPGDAQTLATIDPVRAGLLADYCFQPHPQTPQLLPADHYARWDRLGYKATTAYEALRQWLEQQRDAATPTSATSQYLTLSPVFVLDRIVQEFCSPQNLAYDQLATLRELMETAQRYWEVETRLRQVEEPPATLADTVGQFIQLLRRGTITANPFPMHYLGQPRPAVLIATTFQYRAARQRHRWHFWLDAGAPNWYGGGAVVLWGAPLFLHSWQGQPLSLMGEVEQDQAQLERLLQDLLSRVTERVFLCYSDLSVNGQEQVGPLLPLVDAALPLLAPVA